MDIQETFSANMKAFRKNSGLSQESLAERCGLHRTYIGRIEQKRVNVSLKNIGAIAAALEIDPLLFFKATNEADAPASPDGNILHDGAPTPNEAEIMSQQVGNFAIAEWTENGIKITPLESTEETNTITMLTAIINNDAIKTLDINEIAEIYNFIRSKTNHCI